MVGAQWLGKGVSLKPAVEIVYEKSGLLAVSGRVSPLRFLEAGYLTIFEATVSTPALYAPYAKDLLWAEAKTDAMGGRLAASLRIEQHLAKRQQGRWFKPQLGYRPAEKWLLFANASILTGPQQSYFGNWRSLDSVSMGASYQW